MHRCCRNLVLRRIYLILNAIVPHMDIVKLSSHDIENFGDRGRPPAYNSGQKPKPQEEPIHEEVSVSRLLLILFLDP
jgi:hypothetical protein